MNKKGTKNHKKFDLNGNSLSIHSNPVLTTLTEESGVKGLTGCNSEVPLVKCPSENHCWLAICLIQHQLGSLCPCGIRSGQVLSHQSQLAIGHGKQFSGQSFGQNRQNVLLPCAFLRFLA